MNTSIMSPRGQALAIECHTMRSLLRLAIDVRRDCVLRNNKDLLDAANEAVYRAMRDYNNCCEALAACVAAEGGRP